MTQLTPTMLQGIALLHSIYVDPPFWRRGVGRVLFGAAVALARKPKAGAFMIYAEPSAEGFWERFERAVKVVAKSPPQHRTKANKIVQKERKVSRRKDKSV